MPRGKRYPRSAKQRVMAPKPRDRRRSMGWKAKPAAKQLLGAPVDTTQYFDAVCVSKPLEMTNQGGTGTVEGIYNILRYEYSNQFPNAPTVSHEQTNRFQALAPLYKEYAVTGVKIEIVPTDRDSVNLFGA